MRWALVVAWIGWEFKTIELLAVDIDFMACGGIPERDVLEEGEHKIFCCRGFGVLDRGGLWRYFLWRRQEILNVELLWVMM
eukprot:282365-Ditylum_brightwellii.AAC.1